MWKGRGNHQETTLNKIVNNAAVRLPERAFPHVQYSAMKYALVITAFLMIGCNSSSSTPTETQDLVTQQFTLRYGQSSAIAGSSLRVRFAELAEESRCPKNVVCVWMGNAKIRLDVTSNGRTES